LFKQTWEDLKAIDERQLNFAQTLDLAWIALWHWIRGGDPVREGMTDQTTEPAARVLVGHMSEKEAKVPQTEVKTTKEFNDRMTETQGENRPVLCMSTINGHPVCWSPIWKLLPPGRLPRS
jgi:hypothetical protein